jgi:hypothetical protein
MEDNEFTRAIRSLENKLDKAMIKYNEAQSNVTSIISPQSSASLSIPNHATTHYSPYSLLTVLGMRKTYEQIVRRLKEERVGFDNQLAAIERTLGTI